MMNLQQDCIILAILLLFAVLCISSRVQSRVSPKQTSKYASITKLLHGRAKKDEIGRKREHSSKRDEVLSQNYMQNLEQKFETIKDLGNIYRCKMHHSETVVTGLIFTIVRFGYLHERKPMSLLPTFERYFCEEFIQERGRFSSSS